MLRRWNASKSGASLSDLYQEVIVKYADRVVPSQLDKDKKIYQYTSITNPVQERLARWPQEGLDVYRARFETPAQTLLDNARPDDVPTLNRIYSIYFVTEAGKQAGIRLMDLYLESGEYPAAAWLGDRLLSLHPGLIAERPSVLYRTALAYYYAGETKKAAAKLDELKTKFANDRGIVRGKDVVLAESLAQELLAPVVEFAIGVGGFLADALGRFEPKSNFHRRGTARRTALWNSLLQAQLGQSQYRGQGCPAKAI